MDDQKLKDQLATFFGLQGPTITSLSSDELLELFIKLESEGIPPSYVNKHPEALENINYLAALERLAKEHGASLFRSSLLSNESSTTNTGLEHLVETNEDYKKLMRAATKFEIMRSRIDSWDSTLDKMAEEFGSIDEFSDLLDVYSVWLTEEKGEQEAGYFIKNLKNNIRVRGINNGERESIADLAEVIVRLSRTLRERNIRREWFFTDFMGKVSYAFQTIKEFEEGSKRIMDALDEYDIEKDEISLGKRRGEFLDLTKKKDRKYYVKSKQDERPPRRFLMNYYSIFDTLEKLQPLIKDGQSLDDTLRQLTDFGKRVDAKSIEGGSIQEHGNTRSFLELLDIVEHLAPRLQTSRQLATVLSTLYGIQRKAGGDTTYLGLAFSSSGRRDGELSEVLKKPSGVITYARLVRKSFDLGIYDSSLFYDTMSCYADLAKSSKDLKRLGNAVFDLHHYFLEKGIDSYHLKRFVHSHALPTFRPLFSSVEEFEKQKEQIYETITYLNKKGFVGWREEEFGKRVKPLVAVSPNLEEFTKNAQRAVQHVGRTKHLYPSSAFFQEIFPLLPEPESYDDFKNSISTMQRYMRTWHARGVDVGNLLEKGFKKISFMVEEEGLDYLLETLDGCTTVEQDTELIGESMDFIGSLGGGWRAIRGYVQTKEDYTTLFQKSVEIVKDTQEQDFSLDNVRIGDDHSGDLHVRMFFRYMDESMDIIKAGLLPCDELVEIYTSMGASRGKELIKDIKSRIEDIRERQNFDPTDFVERYTLYTIAQENDEIRLRKFKTFSNACERYCKGDHLSHEHFSTELEILQKYSTVMPPQ